MAKNQKFVPVLAVLNMKGGVGKTTLSANIFRILFETKKVRTLLLDLDPQFNLTQSVFKSVDYDKAKTAKKTVAQVFESTEHVKLFEISQEKSPPPNSAILPIAPKPEFAIVINGVPTQLLAARKQVAVRLADFMSDNLSSGIKDAIKTIDLHIKKDGVARAEEALMKVQLLLDWANYLYVSERTGHCNEFIDGLRSSLVETIFCVSTGLARLALFSMRGQIDIALSWLYFKDHPVEYRKVFRSSDGFMLKSSVISYLEEYEPKFKKRFQALSSNMTRQEKDPYKFLSAHVHSQSHMTLPAASSFESMVVKPEVTKELLLAQENVTEYLNDVLLSVFGSKWAGLPASVVNAVKARLSGDALAAVFS